MEIQRSIKPGELDDIPAGYGWDYQDGEYCPYKQKPGMERAFLLGDNGQPLCCASEYDAVAAIYIIGEGPKGPGTGRLNKYERGLCCWHGCQEKATVTVKTPGENTRDNEEFIICPRHWDMILVAIKRLEVMGIIEPILPVERV